jgi:hypothetical protein
MFALTMVVKRRRSFKTLRRMTADAEERIKLVEPSEEEGLRSVVLYNVRCLFYDYDVKHNERNTKAMKLIAQNSPELLSGCFWEALVKRRERIR